MARILAVLAIIAWLLLLRPFPYTTLMACCMACVSVPFYNKLVARFTKKWATVVYVAGLSTIIILPIVVVVLLVTPQAVAGFRTLDKFREAQWMHTPQAQNLFLEIDTWLKGIPGLEDGLLGLTQHAASLAGTAARTVLASGLGVAGGAFQAVLVIMLFLIITTMCVTHARLIHEFVLRLTRFPLPMLNRFIQTIRRAIFGVLVGVVFVSLIQGLLCGIGFAVAGVPQPAFWGLIASFVAPIPFVGTSLVWGPASLVLWFSGQKVATFGLVAWCALFVTGVDNFLRPFFLQASIDASILALVLAIICGLAAFGPMGIFIGPILVALAIQAGRESTASARYKERETVVHKK